MSHDEFVRRYAEGRVRVEVDRRAAARLMSERMLLPFVLLPLLGLGVALALTGYLISGCAVFLGALAFRFAVRASSSGFVLTHSLEDGDFYREVTTKGILLVSPAAG